MQLFNFPELSSGNVNRKEMTLELEVVSQASTGLQSRIKELEKEYGVDSKISIVEGYESAELPLESGLSRGCYPNYIFFECVNYPLSICSDGRQ